MSKSGFITDREYHKLSVVSTLNNDILIPLKQFNIKKVPQKVSLLYGKEEYERLDDIIDSIYKSRRYVKDEEAAKLYIQGIVLKGIAQNKEVYGKAIKYKFDFIDASNYEIIY